MRTDAELLEFALACEKIEKQGGDVLGYIEQEYPSYTPRATWYRLQKTWLNRTVAQLTEGKPKEKGVKYMGKMMDLAQGCIEAFGRGESVYDFLASQGSKNPSAYWYQIKQTVKLKDPDLYEQLSVIRTDTRKRPSPTCCQPARESGVEVPDELPKEEPKTVEFNGKEYEKLEPEKLTNVPFDQRNPENSIPGKPDLESIEVYVEKEKPEKQKLLTIAAVRSDVADGYKYERVFGIGNNDNVALAWRDPMTRGENSLIFSAENWQRLAEEIPQMLKQLGLIK